MNNYLTPEYGLSFGDVLRGMLRRPWLIVLCLALGILAGTLVNIFVKPRYETTAHVIVERRDFLTPLDKTSNNQSRISVADDREVVAQVNTIYSSELVDKVVRKLNLEGRREFAKAQSESLISRLLVEWGFRDDTSQLPSDIRTRRQVASRLSVFQIPGSSIIAIKYASSNPQLTADVANAFAEAAILNSEELQDGSASRNRQWLANQIELLREKVTASEARAEAYRSANGLTEGEKAVVNTEKITQITNQITLAETAKSEADARLAEIKRVMAGSGGIDAISEVLASTTVQGLSTKLIEARSKLAELSATYLEKHPKIVAVRSDIRRLETQIERETEKIAQSLEGQAKVAGSRLASLRASLTQLEQKAGDLGQKDVKLRELEREAAANRKLLEDMLARLAEANAAQTSAMPAQSSIRLLERASVPISIAFPRKGPIYLLSSLSGLAVGLGLAFLLSLLSAASQQRPSTSSGGPGYPSPLPIEARRSDQAPVLFDTPANPAPAASASGHPQQAVQAPDFAPVPMHTRVPVGHVVHSAAPPSVAPPIVPAVTPMAVAATMETPEPLAPKDMDVLSYIQSIAMLESGDGKAGRLSFTRIGGSVFDTAGAAMATARMLSSKGQKVLVIDGDRVGHSLGAILNLKPAEGLSDAVAGTGSFTRIVSRDPDSKVHLILYGTNSDSALMPAIAQRMPAMLQGLSGIYDVIILNGGEAGPEILPMLQAFPVAFLLAPVKRRQDVVSAADTLVDNGVTSVHYVEVGQSAAQAA